MGTWPRSAATSVVATAAAVSLGLALAACTPRETPEAKPGKPSSSARALLPTGPAPLTVVSEAGNAIAEQVRARQSQPGGLPISLEVVDGKVLDVEVGDQVSVGEYKLSESDGTPQAKVCLVHASGPWAAYDSQVGEIVSALSGECVYTSSDLPSKEISQISDEERAKLDPATIDELFVVLTGEAAAIGPAIEAANPAPSDLAEIASVEGAKPSNPAAVVSDFARHTTPPGFSVCVSGVVGGWAKYDSRRPEAVVASVEGECDATTVETLPPVKKPTKASGTESQDRDAKRSKRS